MHTPARLSRRCLQATLVLLPLYGLLTSCGLSAQEGTSTQSPETANTLSGWSFLQASEGTSIAVRTVPEATLFQNNDTSIDSSTGRAVVPLILQREVKQQFLAALQAAGGAFKEVNNTDTEGLVFSELNFTRTEYANLNLNFTASILGADASFQIAQSVYNVQFSFIDDATQEVYRLALAEPLRVHEKMKIDAKASLDIRSVPNIQPAWLAATVSMFFRDINLALAGQGTWERHSDVSPKLVYRGKQGGASTEFMHEVAKDVLVPLCIKAMETRGRSSKECAFNALQFANPSEELRASLARFQVLLVSRCERTSLQDGLLPVYKLFAETDGLANPAPADTHVHVFQSAGADWERSPLVNNGGTSLGESSTACQRNYDGTQCLAIKMAAVRFEKTCDAINSGKRTLGLSVKNADHIYTAE